MTRIAVIQGHPDRDPRRLCRALADAYAEGAAAVGHEVSRIDVAALDFPLLRDADDFLHGEVPEALGPAKEAILAAEHMVFVFPLWLGTMPALLKAFLEQLMRPGVAFEYGEGGSIRTLLKGRSARIVVTMGMPALLYRLWFGGHGIEGMRRSILRFVGLRPVRRTLFGLVENASDRRRGRWLEEMRRLGRTAG